MKPLTAEEIAELRRVSGTDGDEFPIAQAHRLLDEVERSRRDASVGQQHFLHKLDGMAELISAMNNLTAALLSRL